VTPEEDLDDMAEKQHRDASAINAELDYSFAAGKDIPVSQMWCLEEDL
jgi:hypothetical protein